jgi:uncharacterized RDD family membrane protein YckC
VADDIRTYARRRVIAGILDIVVFVFIYRVLLSISLPIIGFLAGLFIIMLYNGIISEFFVGKLTMMLYFIVESGVYNLLFFLLCIYFFSVVENFLQASPGKKLVRLRVASIKGNRIGCGILFLRNILKCISIGFCGVGYFVCFKNKDRQAWHDKVIKTKVIYEENAMTS